MMACAKHTLRSPHQQWGGSHRAAATAAVVDRGPSGIGVLVHHWADLGPAAVLVGGAQDRGGVDHGGVAHTVGGLALLVLGPLHGLQLGHGRVGQLAGAGEERLNIMLDG